MRVHVDECAAPQPSDTTVSFKTVRGSKNFILELSRSCSAAMVSRGTVELEPLSVTVVGKFAGGVDVHEAAPVVLTL